MKLQGGIDTAWFVSFERDLDTLRPERSIPPVEVVAFGEISAVMAIADAPQLEPFVFKRLPVFRSLDETTAYERLCAEYVRIMTEVIGLEVCPSHFFSVPVRAGLVVFYAAQEKLPPWTVGHRVLHWASHEENYRFLDLVLRELEKIWAFNAANGEGVELTLDLQLSNWALATEGPPEKRITPDTRLTYLDITTPLFRIRGVEQIEPHYLLRGCPSFLRRPVERYMAQEVVERYYDPRTVVIDLLANCIKEGREDLLPGMVDVVNAFYARKPAGLCVAPVRIEEVYRYYRVDAAIWMIYLGLRKLDRFLQTKLLGRPYDFILPDRIARHFPFRNRPRGRPGYGRTADR